MNSLECPICYLPYTLCQRRPRIMSCGHAGCEKCYRELFNRGIKLCPVCKVLSKAKRVEDLPINFGLLSVMESTKLKIDEVKKKRLENKRHFNYDTDGITVNPLESPIDSKPLGYHLGKRLIADDTGRMNQLVRQPDLPRGPTPVTGQGLQRAEVQEGRDQDDHGLPNPDTRDALEGSELNPGQRPGQRTLQPLIIRLPPPDEPDQQPQGERVRELAPPNQRTELSDTQRRDGLQQVANLTASFPPGYCIYLEPAVHQNTVGRGQGVRGATEIHLHIHQGNHN